MTISDYLKALNVQYKTGIAREHAYRGDLATLLKELCPGVVVTNEPAQVACGAPDYILTRQSIPVGYIEAKDIGVDLAGKALREQLDRYRASLDNLIVTDYLEFRFFRDGEQTETVRIAEVANGAIRPLPAAFDHFAALISDFAAWQGQSITTPTKLAALMAGKARLLADVIEKAVTSDEMTAGNSALRDQMLAFKSILLHDINAGSFADLYAQTIAYGMFAARLHDPTPESFSRVEAAALIPKSNPFLRKLFHNISGFDLDPRIVWIVDALADVFRAADLGRLMTGFGRQHGRVDAFMHFYEAFLAQYDPALRKSRGVWYTPDPVVRFIVRAVDSILAAEFALPMGLADSSMIKVKRTTRSKQTTDKRSKEKAVVYEESVHRVQVLDPAAGTGTFLAEVVRAVHSRFAGQEGMWPQYVEQHLVPRLNGFELLMASYAIAHLKLDLVLRSTGYDLGQQRTAEGADSFGGAAQRLRVFLTNSLEEADPDTGTLFASWLSDEANQANAVKRDTPVMVVLGNPPYSGVSSNMGPWISGLIEAYKYVDGEHFGERKHWLHDDYVKFIRAGEHYIETTGEGILAYVNNHSFLDNPTFRGMRWHLLSTFDKIYVLNLHGNTLKGEKAPGGQPDENVFDIQQGVSINIFVRTRNKRKGELAEVLHADLWGARAGKYEALDAGSLASVQFTPVQYSAPHYFFVPRSDVGRVEYEAGMPLNELFLNHANGVATMGDSFLIDQDRARLEARVHGFVAGDDTAEAIRATYKLGKNYAKWIVGNRPRMREAELPSIPVAYRPFDSRWTIFDNRVMWRWRVDTMRHMLGRPNIALCFRRQQLEVRQTYYFVSTQVISDGYIRSDNKGGESMAPLYLYPDLGEQLSSDVMAPNLDLGLVTRLAEGLGFTFSFSPETAFSHGAGTALTPLDVFDYCYAVLYSPAYRDTYRDLLTSDFPRVPYPRDGEQFRSLTRLGAKLRQLHLLSDAAIDQYVTVFPIPGDNLVSRRGANANGSWTETGPGVGRVWINDLQYFDRVPEAAWSAYIGGYQPAQKWLKDRLGQTLTFDDIRHYQRMIVALAETGRVMEEIDLIGVV